MEFFNQSMLLQDMKLASRPAQSYAKQVAGSVEARLSCRFMVPGCHFSERCLEVRQSLCLKAEKERAEPFNGLQAQETLRKVDFPTKPKRHAVHAFPVVHQRPIIQR